MKDRLKTHHFNYINVIKPKIQKDQVVLYSSSENSTGYLNIHKLPKNPIMTFLRKYLICLCKTNFDSPDSGCVFGQDTCELWIHF